MVYILYYTLFTKLRNPLRVYLKRKFMNMFSFLSIGREKEA